MTRLTQLCGYPIKALVTLSCAAILAGCSDDDPAPLMSPNNTMSSVVGTSSSAAVAMNIVETAQADGRFTILLKAATDAGIANGLIDNNNLTVFAPTDDAFIKAGISAATINTMNTIELEHLAEVLKYHVFAGGEVDAATALTLSGEKRAMLNNDDVIFTVAGDNLFVNNAKVIVPDVKASNGIIHAIDTVIMPPMPTTVDATITGAVVATESFSRLEDEVVAANLASTLDDATLNYTVFAPNDDAFAKLGTGIVGNSNVLLYHVLSGEVESLAAFNSNGQSLTTVGGDTVDINIVNGDLYVNASKIIGTDIMLNNGIVHTVDTVILPPRADTVADIVINDDNFSTLETLLGNAGLVGALQDESATFTVFAPTNAAFTALSNNDPDTFAAVQSDNDLLTSVLLYHVLNKKRIFSPEAIAASGSTLEMMNEAEVSVALRDDGLYINESKIETTDILTRNGVIHVIDTVLIPPAQR